MSSIALPKATSLAAQPPAAPVALAERVAQLRLEAGLRFQARVADDGAAVAEQLEQARVAGEAPGAGAQRVARAESPGGGELAVEPRVLARGRGGREQAIGTGLEPVVPRLPAQRRGERQSAEDQRVLRDQRQGGPRASAAVGERQRVVGDLRPLPARVGADEQVVRSRLPAPGGADAGAVDPRLLRAPHAEVAVGVVEVGPLAEAVGGDLPAAADPGQREVPGVFRQARGLRGERVGTRDAAVAGPAAQAERQLAARDPVDAPLQLEREHRAVVVGARALAVVGRLVDRAGGVEVDEVAVAPEALDGEAQPATPLREGGPPGRGQPGGSERAGDQVDGRAARLVDRAAGADVDRAAQPVEPQRGGREAAVDRDLGDLRGGDRREVDWAAERAVLRHAVDQQRHLLGGRAAQRDGREAPDPAVARDARAGDPPQEVSEIGPASDEIVRRDDRREGGVLRPRRARADEDLLGQAGAGSRRRGGVLGFGGCRGLGGGGRRRPRAGDHAQRGQREQRGRGATHGDLRGAEIDPRAPRPTKNPAPSGAGAGAHEAEDPGPGRVHLARPGRSPGSRVNRPSAPSRRALSRPPSGLPASRQGLRMPSPLTVAGRQGNRTPFPLPDRVSTSAL